MPSPYVAAGIIGGIVVLGFAIWTLLTQEQDYQSSNGGAGSGPRFNPGPGYDRPRDSWEESDGGNERPQRRRRKEECLICHEPMKNGELLRRLPCPCGNRFHDACITSWFQVNRTCPTCRNAV